MRSDRRLSLFAPVALACSLAAAASCGDDTKEPIDAPMDFAGDQAVDQGLDLITDLAALNLTDGQILFVVMTANAGEITESSFAETLATNNSVRIFAQNMQVAHTTANQHLSNIVTQQSITPQDSDFRRQLSDEQNNSLAAIAGKTGSQFDVAYLQQQIAMHQQTIALLDELIPDVDNATLKSELQAQRTDAANHLSQAQTLLASLTPDGGTDAETDGP